MLVLNVPTALASAPAAAKAVVDTIQRDRAKRHRGKPVFAVWLGEDAAAAKAFESAGIPHFGTEADAVQGFMHLVRYREAQEIFMKTPDSLPQDFAPDVVTARRIVAGVVRMGAHGSIRWRRTRSCAPTTSRPRR